MNSQFPLLKGGTLTYTANIVINQKRRKCKNDSDNISLLEKLTQFLRLYSKQPLTKNNICNIINIFFRQRKMNARFKDLKITIKKMDYRYR